MNNIPIIKKIKCPLWSYDVIEQDRCRRCKYYHGEVGNIVQCSYPVLQEER